VEDEEVAVHERQRVAPAEVVEAMERFLAERLGGGRVIDAGAGAGAITERLARSARLVVCVDLSESMLAALRGRGLPNAVAVRGDLRQLPLAGGGADGAMLTNVLHLLPDWRSAVGEVGRCVRPGGEIVVGLGSPDGGWALAGKIRAWLADGPDDRPVDIDVEAIRAAFAPAGAEVAAVFEETWETKRTVRDEIERLVHNPFAWPAGTDRERLAGIVARRHEDIVRRFGPLDDEHVVPRTLRLTAFRQG
jgi:SAM-dependent methyltransferase